MPPTLPFRQRESFNGAICTLAIHHFDDLEASFAEAARVLDNGGDWSSSPPLPEQIKRYWLSAYFPTDDGAVGRADAGLGQRSKSRCSRAGFRTWTQKRLCWMPEQPFDMFLYSGKHQPHLYLDQRVRANISAFANLADP